ACASRAYQQLWSLRLPLPRSVTLPGVPDPSGSVPEGCVVVVALPPPAAAGGGGGGAAAAAARSPSPLLQPQHHPTDSGREVVVYRFPGLHPRDLRKLRLIPPPPELLLQLGLSDPAATGASQPAAGAGDTVGNTVGGGCFTVAGGAGAGGAGAGAVSAALAGAGGCPGGGGSMLVFSTRGVRPAAGELAGGDYDGDQFTLIWDPRVVQQFEECPPGDLEEEEGGAEKEGDGMYAGSSSSSSSCRAEPFTAERVSLQPPLPPLSTATAPAAAAAAASSCASGMAADRQPPQLPHPQ
ncbi:hypothetical protein Agub_g8015, partial [Astrephomene gubernaculifera]